MIRKSIFFLCAALFTCSSMMYAMEANSQTPQILLERNCEGGSVKLVRTAFKERPIFSLVDTDGTTKLMVCAIIKKERTYLFRLGTCKEARSIRTLLFERDFEKEELEHLEKTGKPLQFSSFISSFGWTTYYFPEFYDNLRPSEIFPEFQSEAGYQFSRDLYCFDRHYQGPNSWPNLEKTSINDFFHLAISFYLAVFNNDIETINACLDEDTTKSLLQELSFL